MKKNLALACFIAVAVVIIYAYPGGAAQSGIDGTNASGAGGCGGCHGSTSSLAAKVELDSAGVAVTSYHPGVAYTVKISATNSTGSTLPKFGFQLTVVKLAGSGTTPVDAGTWGTMPGSVQKSTPAQTGLTETVIEQTTQITATSGSGTNGSTYVESIPWTAPAAGTGTVVVYGVMNAVNNNGGSSGDKYQVATSVNITEAVAAPLVAGVSIAITSGSSTICAGSSVTFTATPTNGGTAPTYQWKKNGSNITGATSSTYTSTTLANTDVITCVMTSNLSGVTGNPATSNSITMTVTSPVTPSVSIAASQNNVCSGTSITFTATPTNGGGSPTYQWKKNGTNIGGATSSTYTTTTLVNGDIITCVLTSNLTCVTSATATSNSVTMTINPSVTPSVSIVSTGSTICAGSSVTFTATPTNGGSTPTYQWVKNGSNISGATSSTYTTTTLVNGDVITVQITSNAVCASPATVTSNSITMVVTATVTPSVNIVSNVGSSICPGQSVTFTATPTNGGNAPTYQWKKNGTNIGGATASTYTSTTLTNGDVITVQLTSNSSCAVPTTATSNAITISVVTNATPSVSIVASPGNSICSGQTITFTATPVNGGSSPTYQWQKNGSTIGGATFSTYSSSSLVNGDVITVVMTSNSTCVSQPTATSNSITISIVTNATATVNIVASPGNVVCSGQTVTFTATPTNGGSSPTYQWKKNGNTIGGATSSTYSTTGLSNGDLITCVMTSSSTCVSQQVVTSNTITITATGTVTPVVSASSDIGTNVCSGQTVNFTATPLNGGSAPVYQWKRNGLNISGANSSVYSTSTVSTGDVISVQMTSSSTCASPSTVISNSVTMNVNPTVTPVLSISSDLGLNICQGQSVTFSSSALNEGSSPVYDWSKNGTHVANGATYTDNTLQNGDVIACVLTSNAICATPANANSNSLNITVYALPLPVITNNANTLVSTAENTYQWQLNGNDLNGATMQSYTPTSNGSYTVKVTDVHGCQNTSASFDVNFLAITEAGSFGNILVYPNPATSTITLDFGNDDVEGVSLKLTDLNGHELLSNLNIQRGKNVFNISSVESGVYILQIAGTKGTAFKRIILGN